VFRYNRKRRFPMDCHVHRFVADFEDDDEGLYYVVDGGERRGPFPDPIERSRDLLQVLTAWGERARGLGGSLYRETERTWLVTLPETCPISGGSFVWSDSQQRWRVRRAA
jgi:hypothetical protein